VVLKDTNRVGYLHRCECCYYHFMHRSDSVYGGVFRGVFEML
jgi:hypothetical protein